MSGPKNLVFILTRILLNYFLPIEIWRLIFSFVPTYRRFHFEKDGESWRWRENVTKEVERNVTKVVERNVTKVVGRRIEIKGGEKILYSVASSTKCIVFIGK